MRLFFVLLALLFALPAWAAVNVNTADQAELESLPGIGASKAVAIIQYRTDHGPFKSVDDLDAVSGIGPSTLASLRDLVTVGGGDSVAAAAVAPAADVPAGTAPAATSTPVSASCSSVNINTADAGTLESLPGIGPSKAAAIVQYRTDHGKFGACDELDAVSGIGPATLAGLRDCCTVK
jgi:competence protein ComEA